MNELANKIQSENQQTKDKHNNQGELFGNALTVENALTNESMIIDTVVTEVRHVVL